MANELDHVGGVDITLQFISANLATGAGTVDMTLAQGGTGLLVPAGYTFHPRLLVVTKTGTFDADAEVTARVIIDGTEVGAAGDGALLTHTPDVARKAAVYRVGQFPAAAGTVVGVSLTKDADYDTTGTIDFDAILVGTLLPAAGA